MAEATTTDRLPHSGSVFPELAADLAGYEKSSGALRFPVEPAALVERLITVRLSQALVGRPD